MAKRQNHKQSRISKEMEATLDLMMYISDPEEKRKLREHYDMLHKLWRQESWQSRFPHHDLDGGKVKKEQDGSQIGPDLIRTVLPTIGATKLLLKPETILGVLVAIPKM